MNAEGALVWPVPPFTIATGCAQLTERVPEEVIGPPVTLNVPGMDKPILVTVPPPLPPPETRSVFVVGSYTALRTWSAPVAILYL